MLLSRRVRNGLRKRDASKGWLGRHLHDSEQECNHDNELPFQRHLERNEGDYRHKNDRDFGYRVNNRDDFQAKDLRTTLVQGLRDDETPKRPSTNQLRRRTSIGATICAIS